MLPRNLLEIGFLGGIYPINPKYDSILDQRCYATLGDLPEVPDAIYVGVGADRAIAEIRAASALGVRAAVVHAGGFAEIGEAGSRIQKKLTDAAAQSGMVICGPNCLGVINVHDRVMLYGASMPQELRPGAIGAVFQSGSILLALMNAGRDLRFSYLISSGNEASLDCADYFDFLVDDPRTKVVIGFIDGFRRPERFMAAAQRAAAARKPIIILKPGRSGAGRKAALAHTGVLAGSDQVLEAVFRKYGVIRAHDLDELAEMAVLFSGVQKLPNQVGVAITCVSGGEMAIVLDSANDENVQLPALQPPVVTAIKERIPSHIRVANPLDITAVGLYEPDLYRQVLVELAANPRCGMIAVSQDFPGGMGAVQSKRYKEVAHAFVAAVATIDKPLIVFCNLSGDTDREIRSILTNGKIPILLGTRESMKAVRHFVRFGCQKISYAKATEPIDPAASVANNIAPDVVQTARRKLREANGALSEQDSKAFLSQFGVRVPKEIVAASPTQAATASDTIGYPVVLKIASADIPHKTEAGGVKMNLTTANEVAVACDKIIANARAYSPDAHIDGVSVQEQVTGAIECIVGCSRDEQFGPVILFGLGGIFVEVMKDVALALAPLDHSEAEALVRSVRGFALLDGARGRPRADLDALINLLVSLSHIAIALGDDFQAADINPLLVLPSGGGIVAADALVVSRSQHPDLRPAVCSDQARTVIIQPVQSSSLPAGDSATTSDSTSMTPAASADASAATSSTGTTSTSQ